MSTLARAYGQCRRLHRRRGVTSFWASRVMPAVTRPHVDALYAFLRCADDVADTGPPHAEHRAGRLAALEGEFLAGLEGDRPGDPVVLAMVHTARMFGIRAEVVQRYFGALRTDLTRTGFGTFSDLALHMDAASVSVAEMMLPILDAESAEVRDYGRDLAFALHLTNIIRDVAEDLDQGRVYLPQEDLDRFGADPRERRVSPEWRDLMRFEIARARDYYASAGICIARHSGRSAACVRAGADLYSRILDRIEANDYDVFSGRTVVPLATKLGVAAKHAALVGLGR